MALPYQNRVQAGRALAQTLRRYAGDPPPLLVALPRGGVPVAAEVARALHAPLDLLIARKLGVPNHEELAFGAVASGGALVLNRALLEGLDLSHSEVEAIIARERAEVARRERLYRGNRPPLDIAGRTVIVVDDGLATGATMRAALQAVRQLRPARLVAAVPVGAPASCAALRPHVDALHCPLQPEPFRAVGVWYDAFPQVSDEEVRALLAVGGTPVALDEPTTRHKERAMHDDSHEDTPRRTTPSQAEGERDTVSSQLDPGQADTPDNELSRRLPSQAEGDEDTVEEALNDQ